VLAFASGLVGWWLFSIRSRMQLIRRGLLLTILILHVSMKPPVWFLLARMSIFDGSTGWHRSILIDRAIHHFDEWWLVGTYSTSSWGYFMFDVTNTYVLAGVEGGLITMLLFIRVIVRSFASAGLAVKAWGDTHRAEQKLAWALGCALLVHAIDFISVVYCDQNVVCWYLLLAMLSACRAIPREALDREVASEVVSASKRARHRTAGDARTHRPRPRPDGDLPGPQEGGLVLARRDRASTHAVRVPASRTGTSP
jgi:hypothetical protein